MHLKPCSDVFKREIRKAVLLEGSSIVTRKYRGQGQLQTLHIAPSIQSWETSFERCCEDNEREPPISLETLDPGPRFAIAPSLLSSSLKLVSGKAKPQRNCTNSPIAACQFCSGTAFPACCPQFSSSGPRTTTRPSATK